MFNQNVIIGPSNAGYGGNAGFGPHYGVPKSPEVRIKMSEAQLGEKNHRYGKKLTEVEKRPSLSTTK